MANTIQITGTGGIIEGNLGTANVNVNLDAAIQFGLDGSGNIGAVHRITQTGFTHHNRDISFSCWYKAEAPYTISPSRTALFSMVNGTDAYRTLWFGIEGNDDNPDFRGYTGNGSSYDNHDIVTITDDQVETWNHYAVTISSGNTNSYTVKLYINGVLKATDTSHVQSYDSTARAPQVGDSGYRDLDGYIKDWRCYGTELDINDIKILASKMNVDNALLANSAELQLQYKLDGTDISSTTVTNAGNASSSNGTLNTTTGIVTHYDEFSVDVYDGYDGSDATTITTTDGTFTITQGKVEGKALSSVEFNGSDDFININNSLESWTESAQKTMAAWVYNDGNSNVARIFNTGYQSSGSKTAFGLGISLSGHANKPFAFLRDTSAAAIQQAFGEVHSTNTWMHYAIVQDGANDQAFLYQNGVLQATVSSVGEIDATTSTSAKIGVHWDTGQSGYFNGKIKDVRLYDYDLNDEQVVSLYSGSYAQTPLHHWKLDEGYTSGTTANTAGAFEDSGNANTTKDGQGAGLVNASCVNGTLDLDGDLTVAANGTLSAPRGNLEIGAEYHNFVSGSTFTHNNGTYVQNKNGGTSRFNNSNSGNTSVTFYNYTINGNTSKFYTGCTFENALTVTNGTAGFMCDSAGSAANATWTLGTTSNQATFSIASGQGARFQKNRNAESGEHTGTLQGASSLYPAIISGSGTFDWDYQPDVSSAGQGEIELKNVDVQFAVTTGGGGGTNRITLTGDCEFDDFTVSSGGDKLDLNGQRAEFSGNLSNQSTGDGNGVDYDGMIYFTGSGRMDSDGASSNLDKLTLVQQGTSTSDADLAGDNLIKTFFYNQPSVTQKNHRGAIQTIIGTGTSTCGSGESPDYTNLSVATGGTLDASSSTLTVAGDFTTSGGLIGKSAGEFVTDDGGTNHNYIQAGSSANSDGWTNISVEAWVKLDHLGKMGSESTFFSRGSNSTPKFGLYGGKLRFYANAASKAFGGTGDNGDVANQETLVTDKWYHVAMTYNNTTGAGKLYVNGKLDLEATIDAGCLTADVGVSAVGAQGAGNRAMDGVMGKISIWNHELTQAEIRELMFMNGAEMQAASTFSSNKNDCKFFYEFNEGTGATIADSGPGGNNGTWAHNNGGTAAVWAAGGTYTRGTSTLVMSKSGTQTITSLSGTFFENLTVSDGSTTQLHTLGQTGGNLNIAGNFIINEKIKPHASTPNTFLGFYVGDKTITITEPTTGIAEIVKLTFNHTSGTLTLPFCYLQTLDCAGNGGTTVQSSTLRSTAELQVRNGHTYNSSAATLEFKVIDLHNGSTVDLSGSLVEQKPASSDGAIAFGSTSVVTMGNKSGRGVAIIGNDTGGENTAVNMPAAGDYFMFGGGQGGKNTMEKCHMASGSDVTVQGTTLGITFADSTANVHQFIQNIDTKHMLDVDPTDDDDLSLPRPTLDNSLQLTGGD